MARGVSAVGDGAVPGVVGAHADRLHVAGAGRAVQQRAGLRGGAAGARGRRGGGPGRGAPRAPRAPRARRAAQRAAHLPVPRRGRADARRGTKRSQVSI